MVKRIYLREQNLEAKELIGTLKQTTLTIPESVVLFRTKLS